MDLVRALYNGRKGRVSGLHVATHVITSPMSLLRREIDVTITFGNLYIRCNLSSDWKAIKQPVYRDNGINRTRQTGGSLVVQHGYVITM